jgi:hypothetical protein
VARAIRADCLVVYTDNDPAVVERGRRMLAGVPGTAVIQADIRQPAALFGHPDTARLIDPAEPTGLLVIAVTQFVPDEDDLWSLVAPTWRRSRPAVTWRCPPAPAHALQDGQPVHISGLLPPRQDAIDTPLRTAAAPDPFASTVPPPHAWP